MSLKEIAEMATMEPEQPVLRQIDNHTKKQYLDSSGMSNIESHKANFRKSFPGFDDSFIKPKTARQKMIELDMELKKLRKAVLKEGYDSGEFKKKQFVTQADVTTLIGYALSSDVTIKAAELLKTYAKTAYKKAGWVADAKEHTSKKKIRSALKEHRSSSTMTDLKAYGLLLPYDKDLTSQDVLGVLNSIQSKKATLAVLVSHDNDMTKVKSELDLYKQQILNYKIQATDSENDLSIALEGKANKEKIISLASKGMSQKAIAEYLDVDRKTVYRNLK